MIKKKIIIGTAQLNNIYGVIKNQKKMDLKEFEKILSLMKKNKLHMFDTAENYNNQKILAKKLNEKNKIITKFKFNKNKVYDENKVKEFIDEILNNLNKDSIYGLLLHNPEVIKSKNFKIFFNLLTKLKKNKIMKIGFSCYKISEIKYILKHYNFQILQFPFNIFDQRIIEDLSVLNLLKKKKIELHIRSIFLQGLLLDKKTQQLPFFSNWSKLFNRYNKYINRLGINSLSACLHFIVQHNFYDKIVVGVNNSKHLKELLKLLVYSKLKKNYNFVNFKSKSINLIIPYLWKN